MGKIIRLDTKFTGANMPKLVDYDYSALEAEILSYPTLRGFFDASDVVVSGSSIMQINDRSGNDRHFVQANTELAPVVSSVNGVPSAYFDGSREMLSSGLFSGKNEQSVNMFLHAPGSWSGSCIVLSDRLSADQNFYIAPTAVAALDAGATLAIASIKTKLINYMCGFNIDDGTAVLYGDGSSDIGTVGGVAAPSGDANLGRWTDSQAGNKYVGHLGHLAVFDEDLSKNAYLRSLLDEYAASKYRMSSWSA
ncbi:hypothetical protein ACFONC_11590 [Luteimonas soli]|uniref:Uncharacterized protein n=1 Tax=Luteimonas soli TaxID=1648966 RepID=A0ABV7XLW5_9GAMM